MLMLIQAETGNTTEQQSPVAAAKQVTEEAARVTSPPKLTEQDIEQTLDTITDVKTSQAAPDGELGFLRSLTSIHTLSTYLT